MHARACINIDNILSAWSGAGQPARARETSARAYAYARRGAPPGWHRADRAAVNHAHAVVDARERRIDRLRCIRMAPFTVDDGFRLAAVEDPQVSPDGRAALYVVNTPDLAGNGSVSTIHLVKMDDSGAKNPSGGATVEGPASRQLTLGPGDGAPRWSPDGHTISFTRRGTIYTMDLNGGEPVQLSPIRLGDAMWALNNYAWSPDGKWIALVSRGTDGRTYHPTISMGPAEDDMFVADRIFYKWNKGYNPGMQRDGSYTATHIFVVSTAGSGDAGEPIQLTDGEQDDHSLTWSPDSSEIAFVSNRTGDWSNNGNNDLFATDLRGAVRRITSCKEFCFTPCWSPNGEHIAFSIQRPSSKDSPAADHHVGVVPASGGVAIDLTASLDRRVQYGSAVPLQWTDDSGAILFPAADHGMRHIYAIGLTPGSVVEQLTVGRRQITHFSAGASTLLCAMKDEHAPAELIRFKMASADSSGSPSALEVGAITAVNAEVLVEVETATAEQFTFTTWDGQTLEGWFMRPVGWLKGKRYPAILNVHGGPHGTSGWIIAAIATCAVP
eukprot:COSAG02_NODE_62_length_43372_cov_14.404710_19_plen_555_part_00